MHGDALLANDLLAKCLKAYEAAKSIDPDRHGLDEKLMIAHERYNHKVGKGVLTALTVVAVVGAAAGGSVIYIGIPYYSPNHQRVNIAHNMISHKKGLNLFGSTDRLVASSVGQTEELLLNFYDYYFDLEERFEGSTQPVFLNNL